MKWCHLPPLAVASWRLLLASFIMALWPAARRSCQLPGRAVLVGGLLLAIHFGTWIASLSLLPVYLSVTLVTTSPLWVALCAGERTSPPALLLAFLGTVLLSGHSLRVDAQVQPLGVVLALLGAWSMTGYLLWARAHQPQAGQPAYALRVYATAALVLLSLSLASGTTMNGYTREQWLCLLGLAVVPQVLGHTFLLLAVRFGSAGWASLTILLEPVGSILLAVWLLEEQLVGLQVMGLLLTLAGLAGLTRSVTKSE
ncbi:MAG: DMT family transporter [Candidatus Eremiobacteraeota bacterium]|nr:DMT family transporter [Candidatus Eremiobacteraeota bacterium]